MNLVCLSVMILCALFEQHVLRTETMIEKCLGQVGSPFMRVLCTSYVYYTNTDEYYCRYAIV